MLAAKASLAIRYDALGEDTNAEMGIENRAKLEIRLRNLEDKGVSTLGIHLCSFHYQTDIAFMRTDLGNKNYC